MEKYWHDRSYRTSDAITELKNSTTVIFAFMKLSRYLLPIICATVLSTMRANPVYTIVTGAGTFEVTTVTTSFAADSAVLEGTPWWNNLDLTYALSSTLYGDYGFDGSNLAVFAIAPAVDYSQAVDVYGNPVLDYSQAIAVNTNDPLIPNPYISDEAPSAILPYVVLESQVSSVPETSSTLFMLGIALAGGVILRRQTAFSFKTVASWRR